MSSEPYSVVVVGAGFSGMCTAIKLRQAGIDDFVVLERNPEVGGAWFENTYPGCGVDIASMLYSLSFAPNPAWSRTFASQPELLAYAMSIADDFGLRPYLRLSTALRGAVWDEAADVWVLDTVTEVSPGVFEAGEPLRARVVVGAFVGLNNPVVPDFPVKDTFAGPAFHSARWDPTFDHAGKRVAVVGTGASAVQIVPELVKTCAKVTVFQRTPGWVIPCLDLPTPALGRALFRKLPLAQSISRTALLLLHETAALGMVWDTPATTAIKKVAQLHLKRSVKDPWMRSQLTPDFRPGCKRMLVSSQYYPALQADNCSLITWPIATISPAGIRTSDGIEHQVDAIVFATGFDVGKTGTPFPVTGRDGRVLGDEWARGAYAYRSVTVSGFPNLFLTFGPNSGPGHNSALVYMESQIDYMVAAVRLMHSQNLAWMDVRKDVEVTFNERMQQRLTRTTWNSGCNSWYLTDDGFNGTMYPGFATQYARQLGKVRLADYEVGAAVPALIGV